MDPIEAESSPAPITSGSDASWLMDSLQGTSMSSSDSDVLTLPSHLLPVHELLQRVVSRMMLPDPPEHLHHRTLERCFSSQPSPDQVCPKKL